MALSAVVSRVLMASRLGLVEGLGGILRPVFEDGVAEGGCISIEVDKGEESDLNVA